MADRNDYRGSWSGGGDDRWRDERGRSARERDRWTGGEDRSFRDEGRYGTVRGGHGEGDREPWRRDRYGSLYDQDRTNYGSGWDRERGGYGQGAYDRGGDRSFDRERRNWARDDEAERRWRDEQMRMRERERDERWREREGPRPYGSGYGGQSAPGAAHWREAGAGGVSNRAYITPETHDYGARMYDEGRDRPSGRMEFRPGPARGGGGPAPRPQGGGDFMQSSPQVRAASEGWGGRGDPEDYDRRWRDEREHDDDRDRRRGWDRRR